MFARSLLIGLSLTLCIALSSTALAQLTPVEPDRKQGLKERSKWALIALKVKNPTQFMLNDKKKIVNRGDYSFFLTFNHIKLEKQKFKPSGATLRLNNPDEGYVFALAKPKPLAFKVVGGDKLENIGTKKHAPNLCFHADSLYFDVAKSAVNFLGIIDQNEMIRNLEFAQRNIKAPSKWVTNAIVGEFVRRPKITPPTKAETQALTDFLIKNRPNIFPNVVAVTKTTPFIGKQKMATVTGEFTCM